MIYTIKKFEEAFSAGKAPWVVEKLGNILSKRIGKTITFATLALEYENDYGKFAGYLGNISNKFMIKINFKLTSSDAITSFDVYQGMSSVPDYTVDTEGLNIIQIVDLLTENLAEDGVIRESRITERGRPANEPIESLVRIIDAWAKEDPSIIDTLQKKPVPEIFSKYFEPWVRDKPLYQMKYYNFAKVLKRFLLERGLTNKTYRKRKPGTRERQIQDPVLQSQLEDIAEGITWQEKFEFLRGSIAQLVAGKVQSIFLYGDPGSGKTYETKKTLDDMGVDYKLYGGGVKGVDELVRILYNNRENAIMVFDDFSDKILKNQDAINILKAALQNEPVREITWVDVRRGSNKGMSDIPPKFDFSSGIIFISNSAKLDSAIASRSLVLELTFSNEEVLQKIESTLGAYRPDVPMANKKIALEYAQELAPGVKSIDYRFMDNILISMQISPKGWKKMSLLLAQSIS